MGSSLLVKQLCNYIIVVIHVYCLNSSAGRYNRRLKWLFALILAGCSGLHPPTARTDCRMNGTFHLCMCAFFCSACSVFLLLYDAHLCFVQFTLCYCQFIKRLWISLLVFARCPLLGWSFAYWAQGFTTPVHWMIAVSKNQLQQLSLRSFVSILVLIPMYFSFPSLLQMQPWIFYIYNWRSRLQRNVSGWPVCIQESPNLILTAPSTILTFSYLWGKLLPRACSDGWNLLVISLTSIRMFCHSFAQMFWLFHLHILSLTAARFSIATI